MEKMTFMQLREARNKANEKLGDLYMNAKNRELTAEEKIEEMNLTRELNQLDEQMKFLNRESDNAKAQAEASKANKAKAFRELLKDVRNGKADREILLRPASPGDKNAIEASGAINLSIHEMIPTLHEGLGLPVGLDVVTGVTGNEVWPVSINDVEMEEVGEVEALTDQVLNFDQITPTVRRVGLTVPVSNMAIDNAAFDLMAFVQTKFGIALREYIAKKIYSLAAWDGNKGPFANKKASATDIELGADAYKNILQAVAEFSNKGFFEGNVCIAMDRVTEAELMATPKIAGAAGGFVIENGRCAGFPYVVSHFVNTELNSAGKLVATADRYIQIGYWEWFALQQHGDVRLSIDATSQAVAKKNITAVTINTAWSMTDISVYINGANNESQAFGLYKIVEGEPTTA
jgi:HK97 family phage major capsid protein